MTAPPADSVAPARDGDHTGAAPRAVPHTGAAALPEAPPASWHAQFTWHCPRCRQPLAAAAEGLACTGCHAGYPCIGGIPDLRLPGPSWIDHEADRDAARRLLAETANLGAEAMVRQVFAAQPGHRAAHVRGDAGPGEPVCRR